MIKLSKKTEKEIKEFAVFMDEREYDGATKAVFLSAYVTGVITGCNVAGYDVQTSYEISRKVDEVFEAAVA
jgi:ribosomal protein S25